MKLFIITIMSATANYWSLRSAVHVTLEAWQQGWGLSAVSQVREQDSRERNPLKCSDLGFQGHRVMLRGGCSLGPFLGYLFISEIFLRPTSPRR